MKTKFTLGELLIFCLFLILVTYPFIEFLDKLPLRLWDESRQAANAIDMYVNHNWLVTYYNDTPDTWNTKPPLLIWLQVISMHLFGVSVLSIRMVSAIAGILSVIVLFTFIKKNTGNVWMAFLAGIVLTSMEGFNGNHASRTADYDALLSLFSLLSIIHFYYYIQRSEKKHILLFFLFITLGFMTKSISALLFAPAFFLYALSEKKILAILKDRDFYWGLLFFIVTISLYYGAREYVTPGYIETVYRNEMGGRYFHVTEGHDGGIFFYIEFLRTYQVGFWFYILAGTLLFLPFYKAQLNSQKLVYYLLLLIVCFIALLTCSKTKAEWYIIPALPLIAALCVLLLFDFLLFLGNRFSLKKSWSKKITYGLISILALISYINIVLLNYHPDDNEYVKRLMTLSSFFHNHEAPADLPHLKIVSDDITQHVYFYVRELQLTDPSAGFADYRHLQKGDHVIGFEEKINEYIKTNYTVEESFRKESIFIYTIK